MGLRGAPPKPSVIEAAQGFPGKRKPPAREPKPREWDESDAEQAPEAFNETERRWWTYYSGMLGSMRVLTEADRTALATLATASAEREDNDAQLRKAGTIYHVPGGAVRISPLFKIGMALRDRELKLLREFGLTPSARTRVQTTGADEGAFDLRAAMSRPSKSELDECGSVQ
jgi:P27 family predicted phage terminase small subunit